MAAKSTPYRNAHLRLTFWGDPITGIAIEDDSSSQLDYFYVALHTADPGFTGDQTVNEAAYSGYARVAVPRDSLGWSIVGGTATLAADIQFPIPNTAAETITHFSVGTHGTGAGMVLYKGTCTPNLEVELGTPPIMSAGTTITEE